MGGKGHKYGEGCPKEETWYMAIKYFMIISSPPKKQN